MQPARFVISTLVLFASIGCLAQEGQQQFVTLGDFKLENGQVIQDARIGFRTYGKLNADKSNVIVFTTWFGGRTEQLAGNFGPGKLVDTSKYYGIAIDALGNGISSSPTNSIEQPHMKFPKFTLRDMVNSQHHFLTHLLHINHVKAVMGISMGGMQTFQWMVSYPDFMDKAIPIMGSPRMASYDLLHWNLEIQAIMNDAAWNNGEYTENPALAIRGIIGDLLLTSPEHYNRTVPRQQVQESIEKYRAEPRFDANNHIRQAQAVMALDVSDAYGGSMERAAAAVKAKALVVVSPRDTAVTPGEALSFAKLIHAEVLELTGDCGHQSNGCEGEKVNAAVTKFLQP